MCTAASKLSNTELHIEIELQSTHAPTIYKHTSTDRGMCCYTDTLNALVLMHVHYLYCYFMLTYTDMQNRHPQDFKPLHLIQLPVTDTPQDAEASVGDVLNLCNMVRATTLSIRKQMCKSLLHYCYCIAITNQMKHFILW
jgi:hypothetical protein